MNTGRSISFTSLRQVNDRLFNHSVHLSSVTGVASSSSLKLPQILEPGIEHAWEYNPTESGNPPRARISAGKTYPCARVPRPAISTSSR